DPILPVLAALGDLPEGWRALSQLVLRPAPDDWSRPYLRLAVEHPLARERQRGQHDTGLGQVWALLGLLLVGGLAFPAYHWYLDDDWPRLGLLGAGVVSLAAGLLWLAARLGRRAVYDVKLVEQKVRRAAYRAQLRLAVFAPAVAPAAAVRARL